MVPVEHAGLDPASVLTEITVPTMNARAGVAAADELLGAGRTPTAVFCANDMLALGVLRRLSVAGIAVPPPGVMMGHHHIFTAHDRTDGRALRQDNLLNPSADYP